MHSSNDPSARRYELSRRQKLGGSQPRYWTLDLIFQDFDEINLERPQMVAKLLLNLEQGMQKGLINNQLSGVAAFARQIISLAGLAADSQYNSRGSKDFLNLKVFTRNFLNNSWIKERNEYLYTLRFYCCRNFRKLGTKKR